MNRILYSSIACLLAAATASAAEDHSAHQQHQPPARPAEGDHSAHQGHQTLAPPAAAEHADHSQHAQHAKPASDAPTESELRHVPPPPPERPMHDMSNKEMIEMMQMDDAGKFGRVSLDEFEWRDSDEGDVLAWDAQAWYGGDYNKLWLKTEGERVGSEVEGSVEALWDRILDRWWSTQAGVRHDFGEGPSRSWAAFGVQGLAPYWFEVEATVYVGEEGRTAARFSAEYEMLLTQRLILQPEFEMNLYGKDDRRNGIGSGLANTEIGLRLRYEVRRELAPYVGLSWERSYGETADLAHDRDELLFVAGLRVWF